MAATSFGSLAQHEIQPSCSVVIAHALGLVREGLATLCTIGSKYRVVGQFGQASEVLRFIEIHRPDIAVVDMGMTDLSPFLVVKRVKATNLPTKIILLGSEQRPRCVIDALRCGASGYLVKSSGIVQLLDALEQVSQGAVFVPPEVDLTELAQSAKAPDDPMTKLSPRESEVFTFLVQGIRVKEIAVRLELSPKTIDSHRSSLMRKLEIKTLAELVKFAIRHELQQPR